MSLSHLDGPGSLLGQEVCFASFVSVCMYLLLFLCAIHCYRTSLNWLSFILFHFFDLFCFSFLGPGHTIFENRDMPIPASYFLGSTGSLPSVLNIKEHQNHSSTPWNKTRANPKQQNRPCLNLQKNNKSKRVFLIIDYCLLFFVIKAVFANISRNITHFVLHDNMPLLCYLSATRKPLTY